MTAIVTSKKGLIKTSDDFAKAYGIEEGVFDDVTDWEYHFGKYRLCLGSSGFKTLAQSAKHHHTWRNREAEDLKTKDHFVFGKAFHIYFLERHIFDSRFFVTPKIRRSANAKGPTGAWRDVLVEAGNRTVLWTEDVNKIIAMWKAIQQKQIIMGLLSDPGRVPNTYETTYIWRDDYGIWCKCRTDLYIEDYEVKNGDGDVLYTVNIIGDLKSCQDASPFGFPKSVANFGYDTQAAHYIQGVSYHKDAGHEFVFIAQEKEEPFESLSFHIDQDVIMKASEKIDIYKQVLAKSFRDKNWAGYPDEMIPLQMPKWYS